jgi:hypothetical protein
MNSVLRLRLRKHFLEVCCVDGQAVPAAAEPAMGDQIDAVIDGRDVQGMLGIRLAPFSRRNGRSASRHGDDSTHPTTPHEASASACRQILSYRANGTRYRGKRLQPPILAGVVVTLAIANKALFSWVATDVATDTI